MKKTIWAAVVLAAMTGMALAAAPEGPGKQDGARRPGFDRKARFQEAMGLTDAQTAELKKLRSENQKKRIQAGADLRVARMELRELLLAPAVDEKAVRAKGKQLADLQAAMANDRLEQQLALRRILNAEQAEKMLRFHEGRQHRGGGPPRGGRDGKSGHRRGPRAADGAEGNEDHGSSDL